MSKGQKPPEPAGFPISAPSVGRELLPSLLRDPHTTSVLLTSNYPPGTKLRVKEKLNETSGIAVASLIVVYKNLVNWTRKRKLATLQSSPQAAAVLCFIFGNHGALILLNRNHFLILRAPWPGWWSRMITVYPPGSPRFALGGYCSPGDT